MLTRIASTFGGTLAVRAVDPKYARASLTARASVKRLATPHSQFIKLAKCRLRSRKLTCTGGAPIKIRFRVKPKPKPKRKHKH